MGGLSLVGEKMWDSQRLRYVEFGPYNFEVCLSKECSKTMREQYHRPHAAKQPLQ
jgi:hypothetical protein